MEIDIVKCNFMLMKTLKWNIQLHCNPFHFVSKNILTQVQNRNSGSQNV